MCNWAHYSAYFFKPTVAEIDSKHLVTNGCFSLVLFVLLGVKLMQLLDLSLRRGNVTCFVLGLGYLWELVNLETVYFTLYL